MLEPHESLCLLEESSGDVVLLGSDSHLFPGSDIVLWSWDGVDDVSLLRDRRSRGIGKMLIKVPPEKTGLCINGAFFLAGSYLGRENVVVVNWQ